jgi:hypothetical protein
MLKWLWRWFPGYTIQLVIQLVIAAGIIAVGLGATVFVTLFGDGTPALIGGLVATVAGLLWWRRRRPLP